jgi:hypothetical protein
MFMRLLMLCVVVATVCVAPQSQGAIVHRYSFNDGTARDSAGAADGTLVHNPGIAGGQLVFDPAVNNGINTNVITGQYVDLPNGVANLRNLTIETWFTWRGGDRFARLYDFGNVQQKIDVLPSDTTQTYAGQGYIVLSPRNNPGNMFAQISLDTHGGASDTNIVAMATPLPTATELHVTFVYDRDGGQERLYLNGQMVSQNTATVDPSTRLYLNSWIGRSQFGADPFFNGSINEFRIYDNALTSAAVLANDTAGPNGAIAIPEPTGLAAVAAIMAAIGLRPRFRRIRRR